MWRTNPLERVLIYPLFFLSLIITYMNTYSPDLYNIILEEYEASGNKLFYDMFGVLDDNEPYKVVRGD